LFENTILKLAFDKAATAFPSVLLLEVLSQLLGWLPQLVMWVIKSKVSLDRIDSFLNENELEMFSEQSESMDLSHDRAETEESSDTLSSTPVVGFSGGWFRYFSQADSTSAIAASAAAASKVSEKTPLLARTQSKDEMASEDDGSFSMRNLNINFAVGGLNVIVGPTGSGKSTIILALLGGSPNS
jgi:ABC-type multidrug transport system fused ATPase/permease subunit